MAMTRRTVAQFTLGVEMSLLIASPMLLIWGFGWRLALTDLLAAVLLLLFYGIAFGPDKPPATTRPKPKPKQSDIYKKNPFSTTSADPTKRKDGDSVMHVTFGKKHNIK